MKKKAARKKISVRRRSREREQFDSVTQNMLLYFSEEQILAMTRFLGMLVRRFG